MRSCQRWPAGRSSSSHFDISMNRPFVREVLECGACSSALPTETGPLQIQERLGWLPLLRFLPSRRRRNLARPLESQIGHSGLRNPDWMETGWLRSAALASLRLGVLALSSRFFANSAPTRENHDGLPTQRRGDAKTQSFSQARVRSGLSGGEFEAALTVSRICGNRCFVGKAEACSAPLSEGRGAGDKSPLARRSSGHWSGESGAKQAPHSKTSRRTGGSWVGNTSNDGT